MGELPYSFQYFLLVACTLLLKGCSSCACVSVKLKFCGFHLPPGLCYGSKHVVDYICYL